MVGGGKGGGGGGEGWMSKKGQSSELVGERGG